MRATTILTATALLIGCSTRQPAATTSSNPTPAPVTSTASTEPRLPEPAGARKILIPPAPLPHRAQVTVEKIIGGHFDEVPYDFNPDMREKLTPAQLEAAWKQVTAQTGKFQAFGQPTTTNEAGYDVVYLPMQFETGNLRAKVVFDRSGMIAGLFFLP
jgi:uncharacterized protein DUF3887